MAKIAGVDLSKKIGPLPVGGWLIVLVAGLGIAWYTGIFSAYGEAATDDLEDEGEDEFGLSPLDQVGRTGLVGIPAEAPKTPEFEKTNKQWVREAQRVLSGNPVSINNALWKYLRGQTITQRQKEIVTRAINALGPPPNPPRKTDVLPPKDRRDSKGKWYVIRRADKNLREIARRATGNGNNADEIFRANRKEKDRPGPNDGWMRNPNDIRPGKLLWIPGPLLQGRAA